MDWGEKTQTLKISTPHSECRNLKIHTHTLNFSSVRGYLCTKSNKNTIITSCTTSEMFLFLIYFTITASASPLTNQSACTATNWAHFNLTIYKTIDNRVPSNHTITNNRITYPDDLFRITVTNASLTHVCADQVHIDNELTILQFHSCAIVHLEANCFQIAPTFSLLEMNHNPLERIEVGVFNRLKCKEIDLSHNLLKIIASDAFENNTHLQILRLDYNLLKTIDPEWFANTPNLYHFNIIYNELTELQENVFHRLSNQRPLKLRLSANQINEIHPDIFRNHQRIDVLRLNGNKLHHLPAGLFNNTQIRVLHVNTNHLLCLPDELYASNVKELAFYENRQFKCECLLKIQRFVEENNVNVLYPSVICENRTREINIVFSINKTYEIPILLPST